MEAIMEKKDSIFDYSEIREFYKPRIGELNSIIEKMNEDRIKRNVRDKMDYIAPNLAKLLSMMLDCEQYITDIDPDGEAVYTERVLILQRWTDKFQLDLHGIDMLSIGKKFVVAPVWLLPKNVVETEGYWSKSWRVPGVMGVINPITLPSNELVDYGTIKPLSSTAYIALARHKESYMSQLIQLTKHYSYIYMR